MFIKLSLLSFNYPIRNMHFFLCIALKNKKRRISIFQNRIFFYMFVIVRSYEWRFLLFAFYFILFLFAPQNLLCHNTISILFTFNCGSSTIYLFFLYGFCIAQLLKSQHCVLFTGFRVTASKWRFFSETCRYMNCICENDNNFHGYVYAVCISNDESFHFHFHVAHWFTY